MRRPADEIAEPRQRTRTAPAAAPEVLADAEAADGVAREPGQRSRRRAIGASREHADRPSA